MRRRPCLPLNYFGSCLTKDDLQLGVRLPMYSCPFQDCTQHFENREEFLHHVAGGIGDSDRKHYKAIMEVCKDDLPWMTRLDYVYGAIALLERSRWPRLGLSTTRRGLEALCRRYNDEQIQCKCCFICSQLRTSAESYCKIDLEQSLDQARQVNKEIESYS